MAFPRNSIRSFLAHAKISLRTAITSNQKVTFVIGNESADLDSLTSSLLYAYIRSQNPPPHAFSPLYIPITNIPAADIQLRPEFLALLPHANLQPQHLITLSDLPDLHAIDQQLRPENTQWVLVDHNALLGRLGQIYGSRVAGVIDHHDEENKVPADTAPEPRVIEKAGSCSSLVAEYCRSSWDALASAGQRTSGAAAAQDDSGAGVVNDAAQTQLWDAQVAKLALASVLVDTTNLTAETKTTVHDVKAVEYLEARINVCLRTSVEFSRDAFFAEIDGAKKDIGALALRDILRKDYKEWDEDGVRLGISSVVKPLGFLKAKAGEERGGEKPFSTALEEFIKEKEVDMYAVMTAFADEGGEFKRELLLWGANGKGADFAQKFVQDASEELGLKDMGIGCLSMDGWKKVWWQENAAASRKQVGPLLRKNMR
ncbi:exopolyphosphatase-like protein [Saccharata proteae CBS 121410]|uniref:Exopolyphosphatase-like protein n=1 Tax=Saccharata proteae CBS 121410 TaxID=1314787 RepID=A0A9P4HWU2_9PEZI|nr:exopolyphosphatase-like protein [Saccharata proteae CBS 121410]